MTERRTDHDSADQKAHGTHGRGIEGEQRLDDADVDPDMARGTENEGGRGEAAFGNQASGGSVIDKRGKKD
jgi:hypothetical protein